MRRRFIDRNRVRDPDQPLKTVPKLVPPASDLDRQNEVFTFHVALCGEPRIALTLGIAAKVKPPPASTGGG